jgi:hypothetical protein
MSARTLKRTTTCRAAIGICAALVAVGGGGGCSEDCCIIDSFSIPLIWSPLGAARPGGLLARARSSALNGDQPFDMAVDTGSPLTVSLGSADGTPDTVTRDFDILGAPPDYPVRARFRGINMVPVALGSAGDAMTQPTAVMGGDFLRAFSVELRFGVPSMTLWPNQRADDGFLEDVGDAVIHFTPFGGGEITANGTPDIFGQRGPASIDPTRIVFRACVAPDVFNPETSPDQRCCERGDAITNATGAPLSLLLATGTGPLILSRSAWTRVMPHLLAAAPAETAGLLYLTASATPLQASWTSLPASAHVALVNQETTAANDAGPCVDLARSRRIEWVALRQQKYPELRVCVQPCDTDPNDAGKAQSSAAYVEVGGLAGAEIPVAILADTEPLLEGLRSDIRPEGPELDGIIGAGVLAQTRVEIDYRSTGMRAIFSCETDDRDQCWAGARCPRLPDQTTTHTCFNLPLAGLPATCADDMCGGN